MSDVRSYPLDESKDEAEGLRPVDLSSRWRVWVAVGLIVVAGLLAYHNSFSGPFIFDDIRAIPGNPSIAKLWPIWEALAPPPSGRATQRRPISNLSLAVNYALGGLRVEGYHKFNLAMHILSGLVLFGVLRRTLLSERLGDRFGRASWLLALVCALIWLVHPLQTNAVTYIIQRTELLGGLFYLLTLYCVIRGSESGGSGRWYVAAVFSCLLGMGSKEIVVSAPLVILLYDRIFLSGSFREALRRRWGLYVGLAATWGLLVILNPYGSGDQPFGAFAYAARQFEAVTTYLRLCFWPAPLILDYGQGETPTFLEALPYAALIVVLLAGTVLAIRYKPAIGFLGVWFFAILGPSSSFSPLNEWAAEKRMYLSLAAVVIVVVLCGYVFGRRLLRRMRISDRGRRACGAVLGCSLAVVVVLVLGWLSVGRNYDYRSELSIWDDTVNKHQGNWRAHNNRGKALVLRAFRMPGPSNKRMRMVLYEKAVSDFDRSIELNAKHDKAYNNRGVAYSRLGKSGLAISDFGKAIELKPRYAEAYFNRGLEYGYLRNLGRAIEDFGEAIKLNRYYFKAYKWRGLAYLQRGQYDRAISDFTEAIRLRPRFAEVYGNRAKAYLNKGEREKAIQDINTAKMLNLRSP